MKRNLSMTPRNKLATLNESFSQGGIKPKHHSRFIEAAKIFQ